MAMTVLMGLKKRPEATGPNDIGIHGEWVDPGVMATKSIEAESRKYCIPKEELEEMGYPPLELLDSPGGGMGSSVLHKKMKCDRCNRDYKVKDVLEQVDHTLCLYHHGRMRMVMKSGEKHRVYSCCEESYGSEGCVKGPHVYKDEDFETMHEKIGYVETPAANPSKPRTGIVALDCEMGYTTAGMELIRLTVVGEQSKILIDEIVLPSHMIIDLNTRYSGIKTLAGVKHNLESIRAELFKYIDSNTILLGHGLENDMNALRLIHPNIIDTAALFPHPHGLPYRYGLRALSTRHLSKFIQEGSDGHDSFEDAQTCMELLEVFLKNKSKQTR
ncbi:ribonuclease H-like domain-containing protein [Phycomyces blakesleeanus]